MHPRIVAGLTLHRQQRLRQLGGAVYRQVDLMLAAAGGLIYRVLWSLLFVVAGFMKPRRAGLPGRRR